MIALWSIAFIIGLAVASGASRQAVTHALRATDASSVSAGFVGMTVLAVGTDLPEIANSIISATTGHGDLNVGDSAGSALTQVTLVLGILCIATTLSSDRRTVGILGGLTAVALGAIALLVADQSFDRSDALLLISAWVAVVLGMRSLSHDAPSRPPRDARLARHIALTASWLIVVAIAATVVVQSFVALADELGVPEILAGAVVLALGTSLPELVVDWTAVRRGAGALALGDLFGSSFLDATLAIGIGPAIAPTPLTDAATVTCVVAAVGILVATALSITRTTLGRGTAVGLITVYACCTMALVAITS